MNESILTLNGSESGRAVREAGDDAPATTQRLSTWRLIVEDVRAWHRTYHRKLYAEAPPRLSAHRGQCLNLIWSHCGLRATVLLRFAYGLKRRRIPILPQMVARWNLTLHGLDVPSHTEIGPGLYIPHPVGTVVSARRIGSNVTLVSGVTLGMRGDGAFPTLGDNVYVGAGARILGGIVVGDDVNIGANAVVLKDVPAGVTAVGIPAVFKQPTTKTKEKPI